jgi:hypothetical protein
MSGDSKRVCVLDAVPRNALKSVTGLAGAAILVDPEPMPLRRSKAFVRLRDGLLDAVGEAGSLYFACLIPEFMIDGQEAKAWRMVADRTWKVPASQSRGHFEDFLRGNGEWILYSSQSTLPAGALVTAVATQDLRALSALVEDGGINLLVAPLEDGSSFFIFDQGLKAS